MIFYITCQSPFLHKMELREYISKKTNLYDSLLSIIESEETNESDCINQILTDQIDSKQYLNDRNDIGEFLKIISKISNNHHRDFNFIQKIEQILLHYQNKIKQSFSNFEIFNFFNKNKRIILSLFDNQIITLDENILSFFMSESDISPFQYNFFFCTEILKYHSETNKMLNDEDPSLLEEFMKKRKIGENDSMICEMIRNDSIESFVSYVNRANYPLTSLIEPSLYETNNFLINNEVSLIEYAAFFGSIKIFQYIIKNCNCLNSSLWLYAIHSGKAEMIHLLEQNGVEPPDGKYSRCIKEAIKCHHNKIANYIQINLMDEKDEIFQNEGNFNDNICLYSFRSYNYDFIPESLNHEFLFFYLCRYNYINLVQVLLQNEKVDVNRKLVLIFFLK